MAITLVCDGIGKAGELKSGDVFRYDGRVFMATDGYMPQYPNSLTAIGLSNGIIEYIDKSVFVALLVDCVLHYRNK